MNDHCNPNFLWKALAAFITVSKIKKEEYPEKEEYFKNE